MWKIYIAGLQYIATFAFRKNKELNHACWAYLVPPARILNHRPIHHWQNRLYPQSLAFSTWPPAEDSPSSLCPWVIFTTFRPYIFWPFSLCHKFLGSSEGLGKLPSASPIRVSTSWKKKKTWKLLGFVFLPFLVSCTTGLPLAATSSPSKATR